MLVAYYFMKKRLTIAMISCLFFVVGVAFAWHSPVLRALCAPDSDTYSFPINLTPESNQNIELSWASNFSNSWMINFVTPGLHTFTTNTNGTTLWIRYVSDHNATAHVAVNSTLCFAPTPTPEVTPTPSPSPESTPNPTPTPETSP